MSLHNSREPAYYLFFKLEHNGFSGWNFLVKNIKFKDRENLFLLKVEFYNGQNLRAMIIDLDLNYIDKEYIIMVMII